VGAAAIAATAAASGAGTHVVPPGL
jgi:hypothetical protein